LTLLHLIGGNVEAFLADRGYDSEAVRDALAEMEIEAVIPPKKTRTDPDPFDEEAYRQRNLIERFFNKLKNWRRIATRYDKTASSFLAFVSLVSAKMWLPFVHRT
jgi:transposase